MIIQLTLTTRRDTLFKGKPQVKLEFTVDPAAASPRNPSRLRLYLTPEEADYHFGHLHVGEAVSVGVASSLLGAF